ncbi:MAG TPA: hypothetical protein PLX23_11350 [Candidatus Hydrogenedens sp.]|nr:hypothetical protein [Candidatus Hydrogenedens sp.]
MSETLRVYSEINRRRRKRKSSFIKFLLQIFLLIIILLVGWWLWLSRDLYPVEEFIPTSPNFQVFSPQLMQNHNILAQSALWTLVEPSSPAFEVKKLLLDHQKIPLWVFKHLIYDFFYFSANDLKTFEDYLLIVRLSQIGCVLEEFFSWSSMVENDWAGGLNLKYLPRQKVYYARKGRILLLSPNRETLIQSITKKETDALRSVLTTELLENQEHYLAWGTVKPPWKDLQVFIPQISFYLAITPTQLGIKCETEINPDTETLWSILLAEIVSGPLQEPPDTLLSCSINTGVPLKTWIYNFETIPGTNDILTSINSSELSFTDWIKTFSPLVSNQFYIALNNFYTDEVVPFIPKYCVVAKTQPNVCENDIQTIFNPSIIVLGEKNKAIPSSNTDEFIVPLIGSSQVDLHVQCSNDQLIFANNKELRDSLIEQIKSGENTTEGNYSFIIQLKPDKCISEINNVILVLTESNVLRFHSLEAVNNIFNKIKLFKEIKMKINLNKGKIKIIGTTEFNSSSVQTMN